MHSGFLSLGEIINNEPALRSVRNVIKKSDVIIDFNKILPNMDKIVMPVKVVKKALYLKVENSICRSELKFKEQIIISKINNYYKEERINSIRFLS